MSARPRPRGRWGWLVLTAGCLALAALAGPRILGSFKAPPPPPPAPRPIRVEVLNGCGLPGAAERVASRLREGRFIVERTGDAPEFGHTRNLVLARTPDREAMELVAAWVDSPVRLVQRKEEADVDVTVIVGRMR